MGFFIIIRGPLGIGKSSVAKRLSEILKAHYAQFDLVLEKHGLGVIDKNLECIPLPNFIKADSFILPELEKNLKRGKNVILDACFYHKEHIEHLVQNLHYPSFVFTLKAPLAVCIERDSLREKPIGRKDAVAVHRLVSRFDYGFVIETEGKSIEQTTKEIISRLPKRLTSTPKG